MIFLLALLYLGTLGMLFALLLAGFLFIRETLFSGNPPADDDNDGWDVDPLSPKPVGPREKEFTCV